MTKRTYLYHVTFAPNRSKRLLHIQPQEHVVCRCPAIEDPETFTAYHFLDGKHMVPDFKAIRAAIIPQHRKAFDRAGKWWFPATLRSQVTGSLDQLNACSLTLYSTKGKLLGTLHATPFLADRGTSQG